MNQSSQQFTPAPHAAQGLRLESIRSNGKSLMRIEEAALITDLSTAAAELPAHFSEHAKKAHQSALSQGNHALADQIASNTRAALLTVEIEAELLGNFFEQRGDVVVVGHADDRAATPALDELNLVSGPIR